MESQLKTSYQYDDKEATGEMQVEFVCAPDVAEPPSITIRIVQTIVLYSAFFSLGIGAAIVGPTLLDLELITNTDTESVAWVMTSRCIGGVLGVIIMGVVFTKANPWVLMGVAQAFAAIMLAITPLFSNIIMMCFVFMLHGIGRWFVDAACNVMILTIWRQANGPWMQGLHCTTGIGALLAPIIAAPFLSVRHDNHHEVNTTVLISQSLISSNLTSSIENTSNTTEPTVKALNPSTQLFIAYCIAALAILISSIGMFILFCSSHKYLGIERSAKHEKKSAADNKTSTDESKIKENPSRSKQARIFHLQILLLVTLFEVCMCLVAINYGNFVFSFAVKYLDWTNSAAVSVTSAYWGAFIGGRGLAVVLSKVVRPGRLLLMCILLGIASSTPLVFFARSHPAILWACTIGFGLAMSPMFATSVSLMGCYIRVSGPDGALLVMGTLVGEMTGPVLVSLLFGRYGPMALVYVSVSVSISLLVIGGLIELVGRTKGRTSDVLSMFAHEKMPLQEKPKACDRV